MAKITPHISSFAGRVKSMNQSGHRELSLSATEARNLHSELFQLLELIVELQNQLIDAKTTTIEFKGEDF